MKISTIRELRENTADLLGSTEPVVVTRRGQVAGVFFPCPGASMPIDLERDLYPILSSEVRRQVEARGLSEREIAGDFKAWRRNRRTSDIKT